MKIAVIGGGFTGLAAAYHLSKKGHEVTIYEKKRELGGLSDTYKAPNWSWSVEKHYHHWFTNDKSALSLIDELGLSGKLLFPKTLTSVFYRDKIYPFTTPFHVLGFSPLTMIERLRTGLVTLYLKLLPRVFAQNLEKYSASKWLQKYYGKNVFKVLWEPLLIGKFGKYSKSVNMAWFWARIKKRTQVLAYMEGGYQTLIDSLEKEIRKLGGKILLHSSFEEKLTGNFDKVIVTAPSLVFTKMFSKLPEDYRKRLNTIPHLHALNLLLVTKEKILPNDYWLNINDRKFPFLAVIGHTNLADSANYGNQHLTWVGNYLPDGHPYLKMTKEELFKLYLPYLTKINPSFNFELCTLNFELFSGSFAQPVFPVNYSRIKPDFMTPIPNVYLANMDMVYPWDRGTNYAIEMGEEVAEYCVKEVKR